MREISVVVGPVAVTGANGFVGRHVLRHLQDRGHATRALVRSEPDGLAGEVMRIGDMRSEVDWGRVLAGCGTVVHLAARVHVMKDLEADPLTSFRQINVSGTVAIARAAVASGVRRFIYMSSIKVNGEGTKAGKPFTAASAPAPVDPYGVSKLEAELALASIARETGLEVAIVRPPLVYGPGVGGNMLRLMRLIMRGVPLPLRLVDNRRSLVGVTNLASLVEHAIRHPGAVGATLMASDGVDLSTAELCREIGLALGRSARLLPIPPLLLLGVAKISGMQGEVDRLTRDLQVDGAETRRLLQWAPCLSPREELERMARAFMGQASS